ncbi:MAG: TetR/AcrR family transcriptional regulator [Acidobacteriota bacterium]
MPGETAARLLDTAQRLVQERGYNAFSYKDLASAIGIRTASIHYHFPTKADLAGALVERYLDALERTLEVIDREPGTARSRLERFVELYRDTETAGAICLCGSLAADRQTLTEPVQAIVSAYLERSERWVAETLDTGRRSGELAFVGEPSDLAASLVAGLQGGLVLTRGLPGCRHVDLVERVFFQTLDAA